jgi:peptide deformylase
MAILKVAHMGHPVLRTRAQAIDRRDIKSPKIQRLIDDMIETMHEYHGIGLAATQVHEELRLFLAVVEDGDERETVLRPLAVINPEIKTSGEMVEDWEGCLSIPDVRGRVPRARDVRLRGYDRHGEPIDIKLRDYPARVVQHEYDHLDGVLFIDRMKSLETLTYLEEYGKYWASERED